MSFGTPKDLLLALQGNSNAAFGELKGLCREPIRDLHKGLREQAEDDKIALSATHAIHWLEIYSVTSDPASIALFSGQDAREQFCFYLVWVANRLLLREADSPIFVRAAEASVRHAGFSCAAAGTDSTETSQWRTETVHERFEIRTFARPRQSKKQPRSRRTVRFTRLSFLRWRGAATVFPRGRNFDRHCLASLNVDFLGGP